MFSGSRWDNFTGAIKTQITMKKTFLKTASVALAAVMALLSCNDHEEQSGVDQMVTINPPTLTLSAGGTYELQCNVYPNAELAQQAVWTSSDETIAKVDARGVVTALSQGTAQIEASVEGGSATCKVTVTEVAVELISIEPRELTIGKAPGYTKQLTAKILPEAAAGVTLTWNSSDQAVVTVDENGIATPVGAGKATITVEAGGKYGECYVTVEEIKLGRTEAEVRCGKVIILNAEILSDDFDSSDYKIEWSSSNTSVADIRYPSQEDCHVFTFAAGQAVITARAGGMVSECVVTTTDYQVPQGVGDFIYSDGSRSSELDTDKEVVGVVFWVGDPTEHDAALKRDYPDCTHGLAMSLNNYEIPYINVLDNPELTLPIIGEWVDNNLSGEFESLHESGYPFVIKGYNNTKALYAFHAAPENNVTPLALIEKLDEHKQTYRIPGAASPWYMPSLQEMSLMCSGFLEEDIIKMHPQQKVNQNALWLNTRIAQITGADLLNTVNDNMGWTHVYWTSTEGKTEFQDRIFFTINMSLGRQGSTLIKHERPVRFVFAF